MARSLCELQLILQSNPAAAGLCPKTPQSREIKRKHSKRKKTVVRLETRYGNIETDLPEVSSVINCKSKPGDACDVSKSIQSPTEDNSVSSGEIGDFPTPEELAKLDPDILAQRCKLGYRAQRIVALARSVVNNTLQLDMLEQLSDGDTSSSYQEIDKRLSAINGFGPYTRANVLMCMGFYKRVPADTETIRHLKSFHRASSCTIKSVQKDAGAIYGKYGSYQFLAYWSEMWDDYEQKFGKISEMPPTNYGLYTASNMKKKVSNGRSLRRKLT